MANKYDIKTYVANGLASGVGTNIGRTAIPAGKTRFLTYIRVSRIVASSVATAGAVTIGKVATSTPTYASLALATAVQMQVPFASRTAASGAVGMDAVQAIPDRPDVDHPLLALAGAADRHLGLTVSGPTVDIFAQYYDE